MKVTLSPETVATIRKKVDSGQYLSIEDVVEAAVLLLDERDRYDYLRGLLRDAEQQTRNGEVREWTPELRRQLLQQAEENARRGVPPNPDVCP